MDNTASLRYFQRHPATLVREPERRGGWCVAVETAQAQQGNRQERGQGAPECRVSPTVDVVIVNWNTGDHLRECVRGILGELGGAVRRIVVVDNGSTDDSLEMLGRPPGVEIVAVGQNLGFAAGANLGARRCDSEQLLFLNPDTEVGSGVIGRAAQCLESHVGVGIVGSLLVDGAGAWQPSAGHFGVLSHLLLDTRLVRRQPTRPRLVDWIHGAFLLIRRSLFESLGGFDERFFMYGEDMDLCARARAVGQRTMILPDVSVVHFGNRSGAQRFGDRREAEIVKAEMRFYSREGGSSSVVVFRAVACLKYATKALIYRLRGERAAADRTWSVVRACASFSIEP